MYNYQNRQYIFKQSDGNVWDFSCDSRQNLCYSTLTKRGIWSNAVVLHKNISPWFYAEMDAENTFHLLFQDNDGNIHYSRLDGQSIKTVPVLGSKTPSVYNKQLYLAPLGNKIYFFYVLQHENSFMLACQVLSGGRISDPKVIDYVSGSSLPCSILYDKTQNIYAFYQSYDGKHLQLGYKKLSGAQKHWSDFTPVTKYAGNCEYPHAIADDGGVIHLCYQRRAPKLFEMIYQQKSPDKNLWTPEVVVHSSIHSFENASVLQANNNSIAVYWVREDTVYYNMGTQGGNIWGKALRLSSPAGRQLQCLGYKANVPEEQALSPAIYPGSLANGLKLAFIHDTDIEDGSQVSGGYREGSGSSGSDIRRLIMDSYRQVQTGIGEVREGLSATRIELTRLSNSYSELAKELGKCAIRLNMLESRLVQSKKPSSRQVAPLPEAVEPQAAHTADIGSSKAVKPQSMRTAEDGSAAAAGRQSIRSGKPGASGVAEPKPEHPITVKAGSSQPPIAGGAPDKSVPSLDPDKLKEWQEWQEPLEWREPDE